jgi:Ulp1 family protease
MSEKNDIVLSYNDSIIYKSDLKLLDKNQWLNDRIIGFWQVKIKIYYSFKFNFYYYLGMNTLNKSYLKKIINYLL